MPKRARIHFVSLRSSLVNLPISIYGPLLERGVRPQGLAVHLTLVSSARNSSGDGKNVKVEAYVGWTGMAAASSLAHFNSGNGDDRGLETVEIDPQYAEGLGIALGDVVEIGLLHNLANASSVATEPVTSDDWEILELHAAHVESTLLSQVRVAAVGQEIDVWVLGRTRVRLNVVSLDPASSGSALLLTTTTEVSIAPKVRAKPGAQPGPSHSKSSKGSNSRANGAVDGKPNGQMAVNGLAKESERKKRQARVLRVLPKRLFPSATHIRDSDQTVGYVSLATLTSLGDQNGSPKLWHATVRRVSPPSDPAQEQAGRSTSAPPAPKILLPGAEGKEDSSAISACSPNDDVLITHSPAIAVPEGHVVFDGLVEKIEDWDLTRAAFIRKDEHPSTTVDGPVINDQGLVSKAGSSHGLAGVDDVLTKCSHFCITNFALHAFSSRVRGVPGLLVTGRSGSGKTSVLHAVARMAQDDPRTYAYSHYVDLAKYAETPVPKLKSTMRFWMEKAAWHRPSILMLDNIDKLMGVELEHADSFRSRHLAELFLAIYGSSARLAAPNANGVVLLAGAESQAALHPLLNSSHLFREVVNLKPPGKNARRDILRQLVEERMTTSDIVEDAEQLLNYTALATQTEGYSVTDLKDLVARAVHRAAIRFSDGSIYDTSTTLAPEDFASAQVDFVPLSLRDVKLQKSEVAWSDVGGLSETKRVLRETLEWPTKYGPIFAQSPLRLRSGLLLYGYPGCGKTLLASAVAKECGLNFISIKGPELLNKYIGASEKSVRDLFERASAAKPCVLFFDEFDSIAPKRGHDSTGVTDRVVNQMLTQMDGAEGLEGVYVLAATSRPDLIDSALLRPGRLDKSLLCNMPDAAERKDILVALNRKTAFSPSVDLDSIADSTEGFSGADLQALVYNAHLEVIHDTINTFDLTAGGSGHSSSGVEDTAAVEYTRLGGTVSEAKRVVSRAEEAAFQRRLQRILTKPTNEPQLRKAASAPSKKREIGEEHLLRVLKTMRPSVSPEERRRLDHIYDAFMSDRSGELPVPPDAGGVGQRVSLM